MKPIDDYPIKKCVQLGFEPSSDLSSFVRSSILGPQGSFLKHIQSETETRVQLRGKGSGFVDLTPPSKANEPAPMHLFIAALSEEDAKNAIKLAEDLIATVRASYEQQMASKTALYTKAYHDYAQYYAQYMAYYQQHPPS